MTKYQTYTNAPSTYNAYTATQSPSLAADLEVNRAIQHALRLEGYTGDPYPMVDLAADNPYSFSQNKKNYFKDQRALGAMTGGQFGGKTMMYPGSAATNTNPNPDPVVVPGTEEPTTEEPTTEEPTTEITDTVGGEETETRTGRGRPGFDEPERMQRRGARKEARGREMLEGARGEARRRARAVIRKGRDMAKQGRIAEAFRDTGARRDERISEGLGVSRQDAVLDRRYGNALRNFGSDVANEIAGMYGAERYADEDGSREMSDEQRDTQLQRLNRKIEKQQEFKNKAGGKKYDEITGTGKKADKRRAAAVRARQYGKKIKKQIGKASRRYGSDDVSQMLEAAGLMRG